MPEPGVNIETVQRIQLSQRLAYPRLITSAEEGGYVFGAVCLSVCLFVCLSVGLLANL